MKSPIKNEDRHHNNHQSPKPDNQQSVNTKDSSMIVSPKNPPPQVTQTIQQQRQ